MSFDRQPELSVIVPVLNEEEQLAPFLRELAGQREIGLELIVSDGGSSDRSVPLAEGLSRGLPFPVRVIVGGRGRGRQLNLGAEAARAPTLLFLHVDSAFADPLALRKGVDALTAATRPGKAPVAGHFALEFHFPDKPPFPYRFYGAKAALNRPGCTHGDQGFLLASSFFRRLPPFAAELPFMEDTFFAEEVRRQGSWLLLPARIRTSPRRFLTEGLLPRQTLNAILMSLAHTGHPGVLASLEGSYRSQRTATRLRLAPFLRALDRAIGALPREQRRGLWRTTGGYVRANAWQIPFLFDMLWGVETEGEGGRFLAFHDRFVAGMLDNRFGDRAAAALTRVWFALALLSSRREGDGG